MAGFFIVQKLNLSAYDTSMNCWKITRGILVSTALSVGAGWLMPDTSSVIPDMTIQNVENTLPAPDTADKDVVKTAHVLQKAGAFGAVSN